MLIVARGNLQCLALVTALSLLYSMVHTGLEKSLKNEKLCDILKNSLNFPQKSLNIFESSLNKNNVC